MKTQEEGLNQSNYNRRKFLEHFACIGVASLTLPKGSITDDDDGSLITVDVIKEAEKIIGLNLTDKERNDVLESLISNLETIEAIRQEKMDFNVPSCMVFNPLPPGINLSRKKKEATFSKISIKKPDKVEDLAYMTILELSELIKTKQVTSIDLTKLYLSRLKALDSKLRFVVNLTENLALEQAKKADDEIRSGTYRGALHGIPYGIKDLFSVKNYPTTWGTQVYKDRIIDEDATVVQKLEHAGAVLLAKLSTGTLASGAEWFGGVTKNPWIPNQSSGGSSAGPAAATAAGCVAFSIGTETNGSMLNPCNRCGTTGLRPTFGRISRYGCMPVSWSFDKVTPICRSVEDCAVVLHHIHGPDDKDNTVQDFPFNWHPDINIDDLNIGYHARFFDKELMGNPTEPEDIRYYRTIRDGSLKVLHYFRQRGFTLIPLEFELAHLGEGYMMEIEAAAAFDEFTRSEVDDLVEDQKWPTYHRIHRFVSGVDYLQAARYRSRLIQKMHEALADVDVYIEITWSNNWSTNVTGHPIVVLPCGFFDSGRPFSITFVGKPFQEDKLLAVAKAFQDSTKFHLKHPQM